MVHYLLPETQTLVKKSHSERLWLAKLRKKGKYFFINVWCAFLLCLPDLGRS
jgi:hypothetical protein